MSSQKRKIKYKCPYCDNRFYKDDLVIHVGENHEVMIPEGFSALRIVFNYVNKKPIDYSGRCTECGGPTLWDENKARYNRQCEKPACKASYLKHFEENMKRVKGVTRISSTAEGQAKMLANRKISGKYKFQNGEEKTYTGSYELKTLEFMDKIMNISPDDIMAPGPILEYEFEGKKHLYITDFLYIPYNLLIEVKDGGNRPNKRDMPTYRAKQIEKEKFIIQNTDFNYLRLTDNDLSQLLSVFMDLKMQLVDESNDRVVHINEAMNALMTGYMPGFDCDGSSYIVNYMQNNVFSDDQKKEFAVSDNPKLTNLIIRNESGILTKAQDNFLEDKTYDVYKLDKSIKEVSDLLKPYMETEVDNNFIYESIFKKKLYSPDQIQLEESAIKIINFKESVNYISQLTENYIKPKHDDKVDVLVEAYKALDTLIQENKTIKRRNMSNLIDGYISHEQIKDTLILFNHYDFYLDKNEYRLVQFDNYYKTWIANLSIDFETNTIDDLYVEEKFRNKKYGYKIMIEAIKIMYNKSNSDINLSVYIDNKNAIKLYTKLYFSIASSDNKFYYMILNKNDIQKYYIEGDI